MKDQEVLKGDGWHYFLDNKEVSEKKYRKRYPLFEQGCPAGNPLSGWPIVSDALKVHPKRRQEAIDDAAAKGVPTEFTSMGQPILRDREHRRQYLRAYGFIDRNSYSGY